MRKFVVGGIVLVTSILIYFIVDNKNVCYRNATCQKLENIDLPHFNYQEKCGEIFKFKSGGSRDYIFYSHASTPAYVTQYYEIEQTLTLMRASMPNITAIVFTVGVIPHNFTELMKKYNVTQIEDIQYENWSCVNARIPMTLEYMKKHKSEIDRAIFSDLRDVFYFTDVFRTFNESELYWLLECTGIDCFQISNRYAHFSWMIQFASKKDVKKFMEREWVFVNGGLGMGGVEKMIHFFEELNDTIEMSYVDRWGYDQTLLNALVIDKQQSLGIILQNCTQRMCFLPDKRVLHFHNGVATYSSGCSPIVTHKGVVESWRSLYGNISLPEDR
ncbi:hypothetical protein EIN_318080 [Entamoeba invadens IP1]|uniref:Uncharacterized protein n=1 Tax=Entamoeba invadens IP1 TaxID=370355 RepID=A0A0A1TZJ0_ENTIV|nr:hypothetical protein EIN_318080 [Entamoeba invadens IP1]ELP86989.1 hypothetical protein EIN_318080 [Entamoeba invadens IP1]|eukprot:XP_004253760.1 hypothetical protein EIN_318080 [Entamoeba invadens IP1]